VALDRKTLYTNPYLIVTEAEYTKHYYAESQRIASKLGGGWANALVDPLNDHLTDTVGYDYVALNEWLVEGLNYTAECVGMEPQYVLFQDGFDAVHHQHTEHEPESNQYFYHPDHLGSSSFITNASGNVDQHLQYLPFGEPWIDQRTSNNIRFTFSGKERDDETGYNYFGARYYNADISIWLSVDPLSDKFPSMTGYNYCFNNPIVLVDPDGQAPVDCPSCWMRFWGGVQLLGGFVEGAGGAALLVTPEPTMVTKVAGWGLVVHGSDMMSTGLQQLWTGKSEISLTQQGLMAIGLSENQAMIADAALGIAAGGAGTYAKVDRMLKMGAVTRNSYHDGLTALRMTADKMISNGYSYEEVVRQMVPARNNLKGMVRLADDGFNKGIVEIRNYFDYGNKLGPSIDDVIKKHTVDGKMDWKKAYEHIWDTSKDFDNFK
jgi:RHS repeat-associated protein